jgi:polyvinyl alcohol dehydrogenase (cytochrome)
MRTWPLRTGYRLLAPALAAVLVGPGAAASAAGAAGAWPTAGHDIGNTRYAAEEHIIGPGNASRLAAAWSVTTAGNVQTTPTEYDGAVYFPDQGGKLWAVAAATGRVLWSRDISGYTGIAGDRSRTSPAIYGNELVLGASGPRGSGAFVVGVDRRTGRGLWHTEVDAHLAALMTGAAVVFRGIAYIGVSSDEETLAASVAGYHCCTFRGSVVALNAATGKLLWKTYTVPAGYSGGSVWGSTPAIDPADDMLYVGTGNNYSAPAGICTRPGQTGCMPPAADDHADSVLALNAATGAIRWFKSTLTSDVTNDVCGQTANPDCGPDFDFGSGPNLLRLPSGRQLLGIGQKSGEYWALDPATGAVVWHTMAGPGSPFGGMEWGSATDGRRVYVAIGNVYGVQYPIISATGRRSITTGGFWAALDAATGRILWQVADPQGAADLGYVTVANGLVYAGSTALSGDDMYVLDAATGRILWRFASGGPVVSGAAVVGGAVYWGSGYTTLATDCPGGEGVIKACSPPPNDKLYAFALPAPHRRLHVGATAGGLRVAPAQQDDSKTAHE